MNLFESYVDPGLKFIRKQATQGIQAVRTNKYVQNSMSSYVYIVVPIL